MKSVAESRRQVEDRLEEVRLALRRELRWAPRGRRLWLPLLALGCGLALAVALTRRRR